MDRRKYPACSHEGLLEAIAQEARVLPLFEEKLYQYSHAEGYSLASNDMLKKRWSEFLNTRKPTKTAFKYPCVKDLHFVNSTVRLDPKESIHKRDNHRFHLRCGPDFDKLGQLPIPAPNDLFRKFVSHEPIDKKINKDVTGKFNDGQKPLKKSFGSRVKT